MVPGVNRLELADVEKRVKLQPILSMRQVIISRFTNLRRHTMSLHIISIELHFN